MHIEDHPRDAVFVRWGRFQIGAFGKFAIFTVLVLAVLVFLARLVPMW
jgi:hypothetical protein